MVFRKLVQRSPAFRKRGCLRRARETENDRERPRHPAYIPFRAGWDRPCRGCKSHCLCLGWQTTETATWRADCPATDRGQTLDLEVHPVRGAAFRWPWPKRLPRGVSSHSICDGKQAQLRFAKECIFVVLRTRPTSLWADAWVLKKRVRESIPLLYRAMAPRGSPKRAHLNLALYQVSDPPASAAGVPSAASRWDVSIGSKECR